MRTPLPEGIAAPPEGFLYYGKKPLKKPSDSRSKDVAAYGPASVQWFLGFKGESYGTHYALRAGSELAKLNGMGNLTIGDWLETLPEPYRTAALKYTWQHVKRERFTDELGSALIGSFSWELSPEGSLFWKAVIQWTRGTVATLPPFPETASEKGHPHAALMAEYAKDAAETPKPWERWQEKRPEQIVHEDNPEDKDGFVMCWRHPTWNISVQYRRKTRTIRIGEYDVPEPVREPLPRGTEYSVVYLTAEEGYAEFVWTGDASDMFWLSLGLIHLTREAAELHAKALISLTTP